MDRNDSNEAAGINGFAGRAICFGSFRLLPGQRLLLEGNKPLQIGSRALDILIALIDRPGELVSRDELMARVWPNTFVEPANLTVHIAALRRRLGDSRGGCNRFLINIPGRGYCFVAPIKEPEEFEPARLDAAARPNNLPATVTRLIGRQNILDGLSAQLSRLRFLTIVGPGGIGKTSTAIAVAERLIEAHEHGVWVIDLAPLKDPLLVPSATAASLGIEIQSGEPLARLITALRDKRLLLVFDNCEHLVAATACLASAVLKGAPNVRILATSREALRTEGEHLYRLPPLASPPESANLNAREALAFPAVQLFVAHAASTLGEFELSDRDAQHVADICRRLDGSPLAIEIAASRVAAFGVRGVATSLNDGLQLLTSNYRTALPRQRSVGATLDWSYALLSDAEQTVFRRLAIFPNKFTLRAAGTVVSDGIYGESETIDLVAELVTKSLVAADAEGAEPRFHLLETTRSYALSKLTETGEVEALERRHVEYCHNITLHPESPQTRFTDPPERGWRASTLGQ